MKLMALEIYQDADYDCWKRLQQRYDSLYIDTPLVYFDGLHGDVEII